MFFGLEVPVGHDVAGRVGRGPAPSRVAAVQPVQPGRRIAAAPAASAVAYSVSLSRSKSGGQVRHVARPGRRAGARASGRPARPSGAAASGSPSRSECSVVAGASSCASSCRAGSNPNGAGTWSSGSSKPARRRLAEQPPRPPRRRPCGTPCRSPPAVTAAGSGVHGDGPPDHRSAAGGVHDRAPAAPATRPGRQRLERWRRVEQRLGDREPLGPPGLGPRSGACPCRWSSRRPVRGSRAGQPGQSFPPGEHRRTRPPSRRRRRPPRGAGGSSACLRPQADEQSVTRLGPGRGGTRRCPRRRPARPTPPPRRLLAPRQVRPSWRCRAAGAVAEQLVVVRATGTSRRSARCDGGQVVADQQSGAVGVEQRSACAARSSGLSGCTSSSSTATTPSPVETVTSWRSWTPSPGRRGRRGGWPGRPCTGSTPPGGSSRRSGCPTTSAPPSGPRHGQVDQAPAVGGREHREQVLVPQDQLVRRRRRRCRPAPPPAGGRAARTSRAAAASDGGRAGVAGHRLRPGGRRPFRAVGVVPRGLVRRSEQVLPGQCGQPRLGTRALRGGHGLLGPGRGGPGTGARPRPGTSPGSPPRRASPAPAPRRCPRSTVRTPGARRRCRSHVRQGHRREVRLGGQPAQERLVPVQGAGVPRPHPGGLLHVVGVHQHRVVTGCGGELGHAGQAAPVALVVRRDPVPQAGGHRHDLQAVAAGDACTGAARRPVAGWAGSAPSKSARSLPPSAPSVAYSSRSSSSTYR